MWPMVLLFSWYNHYWNLFAARNWFLMWAKWSTGLLFLAHLNWKLMSCCLSFCLSENFSYFHLILQNHWANFSTKPGTKPPWVKDIQVKGHTLFYGEITLGNNKYRLTKSKNLLHFLLNFAEWTNPSSPFTTSSITPSFHFILGPSSWINTTSPISIDCFFDPDFIWSSRKDERYSWAHLFQGCLADLQISSLLLSKPSIELKVNSSR